MDVPIKLKPIVSNRVLSNQSVDKVPETRGQNLLQRLQNSPYQEAVDRYKPRGLTATYLMFGDLHHRGEGVEQDHAIALFFYRESERSAIIEGKSSVDATNKIEILFREQPLLYNERREKAFNIWWRSAKSGHNEGRYQIGCMYMNGNYVVENVDKGVEYIKLAADEQHPEAMVKLADYYKLTNKPDDALFYYKGASLAGIGKASYEAGMLSQSEKEAIEYLQLAYKQGETRHGEVAFQLYIKHSTRAKVTGAIDAALYAEEWLYTAAAEGHWQAKKISGNPDDSSSLNSDVERPQSEKTRKNHEHRRAIYKGNKT